MSSRKRKKKRVKDPATAQQSAAAQSPDASSLDLDVSDGSDAATDTDTDTDDLDIGGDQGPASEDESAERASATSDSEPPAPSVSEISELKPKRPGKRAAADSDADADAAVEVASPDQAEPQPEEEGESDEDDVALADEAAKEAPKTRDQLKRVLESLIFVSDHIITPQQLGRITKTKVTEVREVLAELSIDYEGRGIELIEVNGGYQFRSAAASGPYVRILVAQRPVRLTRAQLETLALIAYRQPITRPEVDDVRGVDSGSAIKVLLERELIKILGRKDDAGRPLLYGTTPYFLEFFSMNSMQDLPTLREFTELSDEHRELFQRKTNEIGDLSAEAEVPYAGRGADSAADADLDIDVDEESEQVDAPEPAEPVEPGASDAELDGDMGAEASAPDMGDMVADDEPRAAVNGGSEDDVEDPDPEPAPA